MLEKDYELLMDEVDRIGYAMTFGPSFLGWILETLVEKMESSEIKYCGIYHPYTSNRPYKLRLGRSEYSLIKSNKFIKLIVAKPIFTFSWLLNLENEKAHMNILNQYVQRCRRNGHPCAVLFVSEQQFENRPYIKKFIEYMVDYELNHPNEAINHSKLIDEFVANYKPKQKVLTPVKPQD